MLNLISGYAQKKISVKTSTIMFALLSLAMAILVACGGEATSTASPPTASGEQLNQAYQDALAAKDLAKFGDILTDDFVFTQVPGPGGTEQLTVSGRSAFMVRLAGQMDNNTILTSTEDVFDGNTTRGKFSLTADNFRAIGVDALGGDYEATTRGGKLASLATFVDGPSLQKLGAALAALAPPGIERLALDYAEALTSGDLSAFGEILADDYVRTRVPGDGGAAKQTIAGKDATMRRLASLMDRNAVLTATSMTVEGNTATGTFSFSADHLTGIGVDGISGTYTAKSKDGKLATLDTVVDGPSLQKLGAAMAAIAPPGAEQLNLAYQDALAAKDLARFAEILTDDFVFTQVPGPGGTEQLTVSGKSAFMVRLAGQMDDNTILTSTEDVFDGNTAKGKFSLTADNFKAIGVDALGGAYEATTRDGKLASLATFIDGPSLQKLGAAMAALAAATPAP